MWFLNELTIRFTLLTIQLSSLSFLEPFLEIYNYLKIIQYNAKPIQFVVKSASIFSRIWDKFVRKYLV